MKKLLTAVITMLLAGSLAFAQATTGSTGAQADTGKKPATTSGKKGKSKAHKGGKKGKKGSSTSTGTGTTAPPK
jgi:hypothetical protein